MKFTIYSKSDNRFYPICEVSRIDSGLYINSLAHNDESHFTYHTSGESAHRSSITRQFPEMRVTKSRPPLDNFKGADSVITLNFLMGNPLSQKTRKPKEGDMLFEFDAPFTIEITISDKDIDLPPLSDRITLSVLKRLDMQPAIIVEAYKLINRTLCLPRFSQKHPISFSRFSPLNKPSLEIIANEMGKPHPGSGRP